MTDKKRTKTVEFLPTTVFKADDEENISGDLEICMYEDGSILFSGTSILEHEDFSRLLSKIQKYLWNLEQKISKKEK